VSTPAARRTKDERLLGLLQFLSKIKRGQVQLDWQRCISVARGMALASPPLLGVADVVPAGVLLQSETETELARSWPLITTTIYAAASSLASI